MIFGLLIAFLANDIWDRNKQAERIVSIESETLIALYSLSTASGGDNQRLRTAIRAYVSAVIEDEWPRLALQQRSARTDGAVNTLLKEVALPSGGADVSVQRTMLEHDLGVSALADQRDVALCHGQARPQPRYVTRIIHEVVRTGVEDVEGAIDLTGLEQGEDKDVVAALDRAAARPRRSEQSTRGADGHFYNDPPSRSERRSD